MSLCWKCREKWEKEHGVAGLSPDIWSWLHCHHEPKEKEKCWCELTGGIDSRGRFRGHCIAFEGGTTCPIIYCRECGKPQHCPAWLRSQEKLRR
jgi:hypothetical protein